MEDEEKPLSVWKRKNKKGRGKEDDRISQKKPVCNELTIIGVCKGGKTYFLFPIGKGTFRDQ